MKLWLIGGILIALLGSGWKAYALIDNQAYDRATLDFQQSLNAIKEAAAKEAIKDWKAAQLIAGDATDVEIQIVEKIRIVERDVPRIVKEIITLRPECSIMPELASVFNKQATIANNRANSGSEDTS